MAFVIKNYGSGKLGDVSEVSATVNSYARVTAISATTITINTTTKIDGTATFVSGAKVLIHVSATTSSSYKTYLGCYLLTTITGVSGSTLTVADDFTKVLPSSELSRYYVQAIAVGEYQNLTLNSGTTITPPVYSASSYVGGIVAIMCTETLKFNGGHISLADRGIPIASKALRPTTANDVARDSGTYAGWENSDTHIHFMLNAGDGAAFIIAKTLECSDDSRIGNISKRGLQFYRGSTDSVTYNETAPTDVTNIGGSTILIAADTIENFTPKIIAKYRDKNSTAGQGICRCYIASETKLRNDEGLYAYDCISKPSRIRKIHFRGFGNGNVGDVTGSTVQLNNYATITKIDGCKVTYKNQTTAGLAQIQAGALVMIHFNHKGSTHVAEAGRFILANVLGDNGSVLTLDTNVPNISITNYAAQIVAIPQFNNFTLAVENKATPAFDGNQGGILAIACKGTCNLSNGKLNVEAKGGGGAYSRAGLAIIGNAQDNDKLPIGQGYGSVFIMAQNLIMNGSTSIGARANRSASGGYYKLNNGSGASGRFSSETSYGGYGSNGSGAKNYQGAHIFVVAEKITGLSVTAIATGGGNGTSQNSAGYGYGGGYNGGYSGGSSGWAFIYCNEVANQNTTGTILAN